MQINFYTFAKDANSTRRPTNPRVTTGSLKEPCSILNPVIRTAFTQKQPYNYAFIPDFERYYYVTDWRYELGSWVCFLQVDPMASWKTYIAASTQYVVRSSAEFEGTIIDGLIPMKTRPYYSAIYPELGTNPFTPGIEAGHYVVGIFNNDANAVGTVSYYSFTNAQFRAFCANLMSTEFINSMGVAAGELSSNLLKALFNPLQYIASVMWFPYAAPAGVEINAIPFGFWSITGSCRRMNNTTVMDKSVEIGGIPHHPQSARGYFTRSAPYSKYTLVYHPFGTFELPPELFYDSTRLRLSFVIDEITGGAVMTISSLNTIANRWIEYTSVPVQIGVQIAMSQATQDLIGATTGAVASIASGVLTGNVVGAAAGVVDAATSAFVPQLTTIGGNGGRSAYTLGAVVIAQFHELAEDSNERMGRPLCAPRVLSTLQADDKQPGYIRCEHVEIEFPGYAEELESVRAMMEEGFYLA